MPIMGQKRFSVLCEPMGSGLVMKLQAHLHASKWDIMVVIHHLYILWLYVM